MTSHPLLKIANLSVSYPKRSGLFKTEKEAIHAVDSVSFCVHEGEIVGIVGESGSGKSSLAKAIVCITPATQGQVLIHGVDLLTLSKSALMPYRKEMQIVFQNPAASFNMRKTVFEMLHEVTEVHKIVATEDEAMTFFSSLLTRVGLDPTLLLRYPHELSIGQLQRISLARALCTRPKLLLLDECVSALDISVQAQVLNLLLELHKTERLTYLFISHDLSVIYHLADRVLVLYQGKIVESGEVEQVFSHPRHPYTQKLLASRITTSSSR